MTTFNIVPDAPAFDAALEIMLTDAFGPGRFAKVSERVREFAALDRGVSRVACDGDDVLGCCRLYRIAVGGAPALFLGPLAVAPRAQGEKLGSKLVASALAACAGDAALAVLVVGQPPMFTPFSFTEVPRDRVTLPGPVEARRFQWLALRADGLDALAGAVTAPRAAS